MRIQEHVPVELYKPRKIGQVIEDGLTFLRQNFMLLVKLTVPTVLPLILITALLESVLMYYSSSMFAAGILNDLNGFTQLEKPSWLGMLENIYLFTNFVSSLLFLSFCTTILSHYAHNGTLQDEFETLKASIWNNIWLMFTGVLWSAIIMIVLFFLYYVIMPSPEILILNTWIAYTVFATTVIITPFVVFGLLSGFMGNIYNNLSFITNFSVYLSRGFRSFVKTWVVCFLCFLIGMIFSVFPQVGMMILNMFGYFTGGAFESGFFSFAKSFAGAILGVFLHLLSFATFVLVITVLGIYYFTLMEEYEGLGFELELENIRENDEMEKWD